MIYDENDNSSGIEAQRDKASFRFIEDTAPGLKVDLDLKRILHSTSSPFQKIDVIETYFGKTLVTDGKTQSTQFDEFVYHESLVHPSLFKSAMLSGDNSAVPRCVFVGGGGELATAREVLRHKSVERVVMVDLDEKVTDVCREYLPEWGGEVVMDDPRFELVIGDAHAYLMNTKESFDAIIMDISDPIEAGPGIMLYTKEFYQHAKTLLTPNGVFVTQAGAAESVPPAHAGKGDKDTCCYGPIRNTLRDVFDCVVPYATNIPSFGGDWGFVMAFQVASPETDTIDAAMKEWIMPKKGLIDDMVANRVHNKRQDGQDSLLHYDGIGHIRMFAITKPLRQLLENDTRIMTRDNPIFMY